MAKGGSYPVHVGLGLRRRYGLPVTADEALAYARWLDRRAGQPRALAPLRRRVLHQAP